MGLFHGSIDFGKRRIRLTLKLQLDAKRPTVSGSTKLTQEIPEVDSALTDGGEVPCPVPPCGVFDMAMNDKGKCVAKIILGLHTSKVLTIGSVVIDSNVRVVHFLDELSCFPASARQCSMDFDAN